MSLDLEKHMVFYGSYHHNGKNVAIHMIGVPLIFASALCLATSSGPLLPLPSYLTIPHLGPNLGTFGALLWGGLYVLLEPVAGTALAVICLAAAAAGSSLMESDPVLTVRAAVGVHVAAWLLQFLGHWAFEHRAPALLHNLLQSIFLAPLFVWLEFLFMLGYRPELQARVQRAVVVQIANMDRAGAERAKAKAGNKKE